MALARYMARFAPQFPIAAASRGHQLQGIARVDGSYRSQSVVLPRQSAGQRLGGTAFSWYSRTANTVRAASKTSIICLLVQIPRRILEAGYSPARHLS